VFTMAKLTDLFPVTSGLRTRTRENPATLPTCNPLKWLVTGMCVFGSPNFAAEICVSAAGYSAALRATDSARGASRGPLTGARHPCQTRCGSTASAFGSKPETNPRTARHGAARRNADRRAAMPQPGIGCRGVRCAAPVVARRIAPAWLAKTGLLRKPGRSAKNRRSENRSARRPGQSRANAPRGSGRNGALPPVQAEPRHTLSRHAARPVAGWKNVVRGAGRRARRTAQALKDLTCTGRS
jgi:hypothetical protein